MCACLCVHICTYMYWVHRYVFVYLCVYVMYGTAAYILMGMCVYMGYTWVCMWYMHISTCLNICVYVCIFQSTAHVCKYVSMGKHFMEACMHMCICTCLYVCMCVHLHMFVCINVYTNAHIYLCLWVECICNGINAFMCLYKFLLCIFWVHKYLEAYMNVAYICNVMWTYVRYTCTYVFMFVEARRQLQFSFVRYHLPCFFETGSLSSLELTNSIRLGVQQDLVIHMSVLSQL